MNAIKFILLTLVTAMVQPVFASCNASAITAMPKTEGLHFGHIAVPPDLPVGSVIATITKKSDGDNRCLWTIGKWSTLSPLGNGAYQTNLPGVGIRLTQDGRVIKPGGNQKDSSAQGDLKVELIKTGTITGGTLENGTIAERKTQNARPVKTLRLEGVNALAAASCTITTPDINVNLGIHRPSEFNGYGSGTGWKNFSIGMNCAQGTIISVQFDYAMIGARVASMIKLDDASSSTTAQNLAVDFRFADGANTHSGMVEDDVLTSVDGGPTVINLKARYVQFGEGQVTVGNANTTSTFTMTYR